MKTFPLLFSTETNPFLAKQILGSGIAREGQAELGYFLDGEISFQLLANVTGKDTIVLGNTAPPADNLVKLLMIVNTLKIRGARSITAVIPYMGYAKSDMENNPLLPVNSRLFSQFLVLAGATKVITVDIHSQANESYIEIPLVNSTAVSVFADYIKKRNLHNLVVVSPDLGASEMAKKLTTSLNLGESIVIEKIRPSEEEAEVISVSGDPKGKNVVIVDDLIQTGGTLIAAGKALKELGASDIFAFATHVSWFAMGINKIAESRLFKEVVVTDTNPQPDELVLPDCFKILSITDLILRAIELV